MVEATGDIITVAGDGKAGYTGDNGPATSAELNAPGRVAIDSTGDLFIGDRNNNVIREVTPAVTVTISPAPTPTAPSISPPTSTSTSRPTLPSGVYLSSPPRPFEAGTLTPEPGLSAFGFRDAGRPFPSAEVPASWRAGYPRCHSQAHRWRTRRPHWRRDFPGRHDRSGNGRPAAR